MCRIYGYLGDYPRDDVIAALRKASQLQRAGGPDQQDIVYVKSGGIGANRLAIQGLNGGSQPYKEGDDIHVVFNGEIYNHRELRRGLEHRGYTFSDDCDGSILPALYKEYGADFVRHLDGMFAIAVLDNREQPRLTLAVDGLGIKPLYYSWDPISKALSFASEIPGLAAFPGVNIELRPEAIDEFLTTRVVFGSNTIYKNIRSLEPGQILSLRFGKEPTIKNYSTIFTQNEYPDNMPYSMAAEIFRDLLAREINKILQSDVPVSLIASGGVDSSLIVGMAAGQMEGLHTFHVCSKGNWPMDERRYAREVAEFFKTRYHEVEVDLEDFPALITDFAQCLGQPDTAPQTLGAFAMMREIRDAGFKVTVGGEGSDELFAGYDRIRQAVFSPEDAWLNTYIAGLAPFDQSLKRGLYSKEYAAGIGDQRHSESAATQLFGDIAASNSHEERLKRILAFEQKYRLPAHLLRRADHMSMANSVEMRVPFCQPAVVAFANRLPFDAKLFGDRAKRIVYDAGNGLLPGNILNRPKQHFILPIAAMYRANSTVRSFMRETLGSQDFTSTPYFNGYATSALLAADPATISDNQILALWSLLMFHITTQHVLKLGLNSKQMPAIEVGRNPAIHRPAKTGSLDA